VNRRGFFGLLGAVAASPKALKFVPEMVPVVEAWQVPSLTAEPLHIVGLSAWLPEGVGLPTTIAGRLEAISDMLDDGCLTPADAAKLIDAAAP
jgi:hypothetical protein